MRDTPPHTRRGDNAYAFPQKARRVWAIVGHAVMNFSRIDGAQWAGAFAHYAFFALFPLIILFVTIASIFVDRDRAGTQIIAFVETYVPIGDEKQSYIFDTISGVISARAPAGAVAFVMLAWVVMRRRSGCRAFTTGANNHDAHNRVTEQDRLTTVAQPVSRPSSRPSATHILLTSQESPA